tara:strand:- start:4522 stop:4899 length:378 start_codon:yes stop_codon:yes gene_type:complete
MNDKIYENIQRELDKNRVDEWHSVIPLSEDGACLLDELDEITEPNVLSGENGLFLHENEQGNIEPKNAYTSRATTGVMEDNDYIYFIITVESGDPNAGRLAQITRHDKQKHIVTREEWENSYTCG